MEAKMVASRTPERRILKNELEFFQCMETLLKEQGFEVVDTFVQTPESRPNPCPRLS